MTAPSLRPPLSRFQTWKDRTGWCGARCLLPMVAGFPLMVLGAVLKVRLALGAGLALGGVSCALAAVGILCGMVALFIAAYGEPHA